MIKNSPQGMFGACRTSGEHKTPDENFVCGVNKKAFWAGKSIARDSDTRDTDNKRYR